MIIGYARTSSKHQEAGLEDQIDQLTKIGCEKIFSEQVSSVAQRDELDRALDFAREGDFFVVTKLDRLARSVANFLEIQKSLAAKSVNLRILDLNLDTSTPMGEMVLGVWLTSRNSSAKSCWNAKKSGLPKRNRKENSADVRKTRSC